MYLCRYSSRPISNSALDRPRPGVALLDAPLGQVREREMVDAIGGSRSSPSWPGSRVRRAKLRCPSGKRAGTCFLGPDRCVLVISPTQFRFGYFSGHHGAVRTISRPLQARRFAARCGTHRECDSHTVEVGGSSPPQPTTHVTESTARSVPGVMRGDRRGTIRSRRGDRSNAVLPSQSSSLLLRVSKCGQPTPLV